jgi:predicted dithiol-disulfide oxidoreductase (DUF899 family)
MSAAGTSKAGHPVVSRAEWLRARRVHLENEKALTHQRDALARERRALPWVKVEKEYVFETPEGRRTLAQLFDGRSQLIVYHFMFGPTWEEGCPNCSFVVDHIDGMLPHLHVRDTTLMAISRAPVAAIEGFKRRMGWRFPWASSSGNDFNYDYHVSAREEDMARGTMEYNYQTGPIEIEDLPGASVFFKDEGGAVFHTYSCYTRGLDVLLGTYQYLDLTPKGRDEDGLDFDMAWVRHHDKYGPGYVVDPKARYVAPKGARCPKCAEEGG